MVGALLTVLLCEKNDPYLPFVLICIALASAVGVADTGRTWTSQDGRELYATLIQRSEDSVTVRRDDGQIFTFPISRLGESDRDYVRTLGSDLLSDC